ncbi:MAG: ATPase [Selenomonadaceae bacterium]|nr:ATPase [Selenomonadaceae bacterium]
MAVRDTLDQIENLVAGASHVPLTGKSMIDENDLIHLVEELRKDLPMELERANDIMRDRDKIIDDAKKDSDDIVRQAKEYAAKIVDENEVVVQAKAKAKALLQQAQEQEREIMERTKANSQQLRDDADRYANQVFDQLITHVTNTFQGVQQAEQGLQQARQVLLQAKEQMNRSQQQAQAQAQAQAIGMAQQPSMQQRL